MDMPGYDLHYAAPKLEALALREPALVDDMAARVLTPMARFGLLDAYNETCQPGGGGCDAPLYEANATSEEHAALALEIATASVLLLQNERAVLPLAVDAATATDGGGVGDGDDEVLTIAVVGEACDATQDIDKMMRK